MTYHCEHCGRRFTASARRPRKFCSVPCVNAWRASPEGRARAAASMAGKQNGLKHGERVGVSGPESFHDGRRCRWPGCARRAAKVDQHHVVYRQEIRRRAGDEWDARNALALCASHHATHHHQLTPLPLAALREENYAYAGELLGPSAYDYLRRRYAGEDPRLATLLELEPA